MDEKKRERKTERKNADKSTVREFASRAHVDLSNFPEFGAETRDAIVDTAGMFLYDAGFDFDLEELREIATELAGNEEGVR